MTISAAAVLFAVIWFMTLFIVLPIGLRTQGDKGEVVPGTHASSPVNAQLGRKVKWVTLITILLWVPLYFIITSGVITVDMLDFYGGIDNSY
jgi:predicted secreted protein